MPRAIRKNDTVVVTAGKDKGKQGRVLQVLSRKRQVIVEGVNTVTKAVKERQGVRQAGLIKREAPLDISNVAYKDPNSENYGRVGWKTLADGSKERFIRNADNGS